MKLLPGKLYRLNTELWGAPLRGQHGGEILRMGSIVLLLERMSRNSFSHERSLVLFEDRKFVLIGHVEDWLDKINP